MPSNKKKKKPTNNPARGFATISTASKPRIVDDNELMPEVDRISLDENIRQSSKDVPKSTDGEELPKERPLHELSPEELERQLEEADLQRVLDDYGERSKRDVDRALSRLDTERRISRGQADDLHMSKWLPQELMLQIMDVLGDRTSLSESNLEPSSHLTFDINSSDDSLLIKVWTLSRILPRLGFSSPKTLSALEQLLRLASSQDPRDTTPNRDTTWGLDECLDWLALTSDLDDRLDYDSTKVDRTTANSKDFEHLRFDDQQKDDHNSTASSTPLHLSDEGSRDGSANKSEMHSSTEIPTDSDDDMEPDQLIEKYLSLQIRLHHADPALASSSNDKSSRGANRAAKKSKQNIEPPHSPHIARLLSRVRQLESDILFDRSEADRRWEIVRIELAKERAERTRLGIHETAPDKYEAAPENTSGAITSLPPDGDVSSDNVEDTSVSLGDFFSSLPEITTNPDTSTTTATVTASDGASIEIRDFGTWNGVGPRRVLEETCKARDPKVTITYKIISSSSFSSRHALLVQWSKSQPAPAAVTLDRISYKSNLRSMKLEMLSVSCPNKTQSEAFISTVALFVTVAESSKEEKAHLRLPPTWRDWWTELANVHKDQKNIKDIESLREIKDLIAEHVKCESNMPDQEAHETPGSKALTPENHAIFDDVRVFEDVKADWAKTASTPSYTAMLRSRKTLPIWGYKEDILASIAENQVIILCGETGCGKSTQLPAYILEDELSNGKPCKIYCTEPRRISAISLARRVSEELGERKADLGTHRSLVGYAIRLESHVTPQTRLVYATTGIVMRMLEKSETLGDITHLVLDEVHERSIESDFLLIVLKKLLHQRPTLKVILMSATVDAEKFSGYLSGAPILTVPGRTYPVETRYLEDAVEVTGYRADKAAHQDDQLVDVEDEDSVGKGQALDKETAMSSTMSAYSWETRDTLTQLNEYRINYELIVKLLHTISYSNAYLEYSKATLIFLPGIAEIRRLKDMLLGHRSFSQGFEVYALHSTIATEEQERAFLVPPSGVRKIVLATNIAETGITIPDITCVIDTGKHKEMRFDERRQLSRLNESFISRANAKQRRGRAGRVQKGLCFHLFTRQRLEKMAPEQTPEMLRLSLQDLVLRVKICRLGDIEQVLSEALDPPSLKNIRRAVDALVDVKALTVTKDLTPLGRQLAKLPLDVFLGKLVLLGSIFRCFDATLTIAAILSSKSPFSAPMGARSQADAARLAFKKGDSDLLTVYNAYTAWRRVCTTTGGISEQYFCRQNFLNVATLSNIEDLKAQLINSVADAGFVTLSAADKVALGRLRYHGKRNFVPAPEHYNTNNQNPMILNSVIACSFYPKLLRRDGKGWRNVANNQSVSLNPTSVNKRSEQPIKWLSFYHIMQSSNKFMNAHETSAVEDVAVALLCGDADFKIYSGVIIIDGNRIRFSLNDWKIMLVLKTLRLELRQIMTQAFRYPGKTLSAGQQYWMDVWQKICKNG